MYRQKLENYIEKSGEWVIYNIVSTDTPRGKNKGMRFIYIDTTDDFAKAYQYAIENRLYVAEKRRVTI